MDKWFRHEGLERTSIVLGLLEDILGSYCTESSYEENKEHVHPAIWNQECGELLSEATSTLAGLYQKIGEWENDEQLDS